MKLTYWKCKNLADNDAYSIRARTKREAWQLRAGEENTYSQPYKVTIEYRNAFDLAVKLLSEGGAEPLPPEDSDALPSEPES